MKQIIGLGLLCAGFACAEYVSAPVMAYLPDEAHHIVQAYAYAPATVYYDGMFHQFYCSSGAYTDHFFYHPDDDKGNRVLSDGSYRQEHGLIQSLDHIRYRTSKNGTTWSPARIVMTQTRYEYENRQNCACDPAIIKSDDGYWYLYYQGNRDNYGGTVYVARSKTIGGPYLTVSNRKENGKNVATRWPSWPKEVIRTWTGAPATSSYGAGQISVVKKGKEYHFWMVEHINSERMYIKHTTSNSPIDLPKIYNWKKITMDADAAKDYSFDSTDGSYRVVDFGEVRWNTAGYYEMWLLSRVMGDLRYLMWASTQHLHAKPWEPYNELHETFSRYIATQVRYTLGQYIYKFQSRDGINWTRVGTGSDFGGPYYDIHNLGVSGDSSGWIHNGRYILSFSAPEVGVDKIADDFYVRDENKNVIRYDSVDNKIEKDTVPDSAQFVHYNSFPWAMWQMIAGGSQTSQVRIPWGYKFPDSTVISNNLEYITGDFDGDGLTDLAAVDRTTSTWYIRSSKTGKNGVPGIPWGDTLKNMTANDTIVTGDYDGDGKTDRGFVDRANGLWTVISSRTGKPIWKEWHWEYMTSSHTVVSGDYDGDGKTDRAIVNTSNGKWWIISSRTGGALEPDNENDIKTPDGKKIWEWKFPHWDKNNSRILVGDYDNDGITDIGMVNVSSKKWYVYSSQTGKGQKGLADGEEYWGLNWRSLDKLSQSSIITMGDYNGDGTADRGFVNWNEGKWYHEGLNPLKLMKQLNGWDNMEDEMASASHYKILEGDYNGDGATDHAFVNLDNRKVYIHSSGRPLSKVDVDIKHVYSFPNKKYLAKNSTAEGDVEMNITPVNSAARISVNGSKLVIQDAKVGDKISIMDAQGRMVRNTVATGSEMDMYLPSSGMYIVRVGSKVHRISIK